MIMNRGPAFFASRSIEWLSLVFWAAVALILILFLSCGDHDSTYEPEWSRGVIVRVDIGETFFGIIRDDGEKLVPQNLNVRFQQDGCRVKFTGHVDNESLVMWIWGTPLIVSTMEFDDQNWQVGTIRFINLEGGFYGLVRDDGTAYLPRNLEEQFKIDGLRVRFTGSELTDWASGYMFGIVFNVDRMEAL